MNTEIDFSNIFPRSEYIKISDIDSLGNYLADPEYKVAIDSFDGINKAFGIEYQMGILWSKFPKEIIGFMYFNVDDKDYKYLLVLSEYGEKLCSKNFSKEYKIIKEL